MAFSVGIGLTTSAISGARTATGPTATVDRLSLETVRRVVAALPVASMNLGVGENGLHPEYAPSSTSWPSAGSRPASPRTDQHRPPLRRRGQALQLDRVLARLPDGVRARRLPRPGEWRAVLAGLERCRELGVPVGSPPSSCGSTSGRSPASSRSPGGRARPPGERLPAGEGRCVHAHLRGVWGVFPGARRCVAPGGDHGAGPRGRPRAPRFAGPGCGRSTVRVAPDGRILPSTYCPRAPSDSTLSRPSARPSSRRRSSSPPAGSPTAAPAARAAAAAPGAGPSSGPRGAGPLLPVRAGAAGPARVAARDGRGPPEGGGARARRSVRPRVAIVMPVAVENAATRSAAWTPAQARPPRTPARSRPRGARSARHRPRPVRRAVLRRSTWSTSPRHGRTTGRWPLLVEAGMTMAYAGATTVVHALPTFGSPAVAPATRAGPAAPARTGNRGPAPRGPRGGPAPGAAAAARAAGAAGRDPAGATNSGVSTMASPKVSRA